MRQQQTPQHTHTHTFKHPHNVRPNGTKLRGSRIPSGMENCRERRQRFWPVSSTTHAHTQTDTRAQQISCGLINTEMEACNAKDRERERTMCANDKRKPPIHSYTHKYARTQFRCAGYFSLQICPADQASTSFRRYRQTHTQNIIVILFAFLTRLARLRAAPFAVNVSVAYIILGVCEFDRCTQYTWTCLT